MPLLQNGGKTVELRSTYSRPGSSPSAVFAERMGAKIETQGDFSKLNASQHASIYSGLEYAVVFTGYDVVKIRLIADANIPGEYAEARKRDDGITLHLNLKKFAKLSEDEIEQIIFHEMGHAVEYEFVSMNTFNKESDKRLAFEEGRKSKLEQSTTSALVLNSLKTSGVAADYDQFRGKIVFKDDALKETKRISLYAVEGAAGGMQDSELIAEAIRYVANNGYGKNEIADAVAKTFFEVK